MKNAAVGQHLLSGQSSLWASHRTALTSSDFSGALSGFWGAILLQPREHLGEALGIQFNLTWCTVDLLKTRVQQGDSALNAG